MSGDDARPILQVMTGSKDKPYKQPGGLIDGEGVDVGMVSDVGDGRE